MGHGVLQLSLQLPRQRLDALNPTAVDRGDIGPGQNDRVSPQGQRLAHIHASADAAVHQDCHLAFYRIRNGRQDGRGGGNSIQHTSSMVGHHNTSGARLQGFSGSLDGHDTLDEKGHARVVDDLSKLCHRLGARRRGQPLQEGQSRSVDVHGKYFGAGGLGIIQLGKNGIPVPGLDSGDPLPAVLSNGLGGPGKDLRVCPSPIKAAIPAWAQPGTRMSL